MRRELKIGRPELCQKIGVSETQMVRYESGKNDPSGDVIVKMAQALGVTSDFLLGLTESVRIAEKEEEIEVLKIGKLRLYHKIHEIDMQEYDAIRDLRAMDDQKRETALKMLRFLSGRDEKTSGESLAI